MWNPLASKKLAPFIDSSGNGFLTGQVFAIAGSLKHFVLEAPPGRRLESFRTNLAQASFSTGVSMATWSIVSSIVEPVVGRYIQTGWLKSMVNSAATGALTELRNGPTGMLGGAMTGVMQSVFMTGVQKAAGTVLAPLHEYRRQATMKKFNEARNQAMFETPFSVFESVFAK